jgi:hypothetical protein
MPISFRHSTSHAPHTPLDLLPSLQTQVMSARLLKRFPPLSSFLPATQPPLLLWHPRTFLDFISFFAHKSSASSRATDLTCCRQNQQHLYTRHQSTHSSASIAYLLSHLISYSTRKQGYVSTQQRRQAASHRVHGTVEEECSRCSGASARHRRRAVQETWWDAFGRRPCQAGVCV